jgi:hypothetical protein
MNYRLSRMQQRGGAMAVGLFVLLTITACASDQPKPLPQPTPDQVRSHADRAFEKLKQEEQEQPTQPPVPR